MQNIDNFDFKRLVKLPNAVVFDVRTPKEVSEGFIAGTKIFADINNAEVFEEAIKKLDKGKDYLVYCRSGARSTKACKMMEEKGFTGKLYNLALGYNGWKD